MADEIRQKRQFTRLKQIADVEAPTPQAGETLVYDDERGRWVPQAIDTDPEVMTDDTAIPSGDTGTVSQLLSWLANRIKAITGKTSWTDDPDITLAGAAAHVADSANPHQTTAAQVDAAPTNHNHDSSYAPLTHKSRHALGGADQLTPDDIGALAKSGSTMTGTLSLQNPSAASTIELGKLAVSETPLIDFHSGGFSSDYDVRLVSSDGGAASGFGTLDIKAGKLLWNGADLFQQDQDQLSANFALTTSFQTVLSVTLARPGRWLVTVAADIDNTGGGSNRQIYGAIFKNGAPVSGVMSAGVLAGMQHTAFQQWVVTVISGDVVDYRLRSDPGGVPATAFGTSISAIWITPTTITV